MEIGTEISQLALRLDLANSHPTLIQHRFELGEEGECLKRVSYRHIYFVHQNRKEKSKV